MPINCTAGWATSQRRTCICGPNGQGWVRRSAAEPTSPRHGSSRPWRRTPLSEDSLIDADSAARVGTVAASATGEVNRRDWQRWAAAVGDHNPLWFDAEYARANGFRDIICPPLFLQYAVLGVARLDALRPDGSSGAISGSLAFPRAPKRMAGGESFTFHLPAYHRDEIEMVRTIESIVEKQGRSGRFVLVTWHTVYRNQHRDLVAEASTSMIARP